MSIFINKDTKVITQGITGKTGQFHTRMCRDYANGKAAFVAGVNPKKAGEDFEGIPIFANVTEAAKATVDWAFHELKAHRVRVAAATDNHPSLSVIGRLGFKFEGIARQAELVNNRWLDHAVFSRLTGET